MALLSSAVGNVGDVTRYRHTEYVTKAGGH
jgi:hypothetical protein